MFAIAAVIVIAIILLYVLCYILSSKNRVGWLIAALVFFAIDTAVMFLWYEITVDIMLDIVFHIWIIVILSTGIAAHFKLQRLPEEPMPVFETDPYAPIAESDAREDSTMLRFADTEVKAKILLEFKAFEHSIVYRRVKKVNELVIDGKVHAEYTALLEKSHMLTANIDGHEIAVGLDSFGFSYATVDGMVAAKKLRLI